MATSSLLTPEEVAEKLKMTPQTVRAYLRQGKIRGLQVGGKWRMTEAAFEAFVKGLEEATRPRHGAA